jgi:magnesium transporter
MIRHLTFMAGKVKKGDKLNYRIPKKGEYLLIFLTRPTNDEINKLARDFRLDAEPLRTYIKETHSRRYITKPFQFVMRTAYIQKNIIGYANLLFILMNRILIVSASKPSDYYEEIVEDVAESFQKFEARSIGHILYNFLQEDVDENYEVLGRLEQQIKDVEAKATRTSLKETKVRVEDILALKRQLFRLSRQFWATTRVISLIRIGVAQIEIDKESERLLGDVHETFLHQIDLAAAQKEMISDALSVYSTSISNISAMTSNELNLVVKKLTSYGAILLIPTVIASIYGMNVSHLPFAQHQYGFYIVMGIMTVITGLVLANFIKNDWL